MAYYPDLGHDSDIARGPFVRAVGWLSAAQPYSRGAATEDFLARVQHLCNAWSESGRALGWPVAAGPHRCEFCNEFLSSGNFGVPHGEVLYVAPQMIAHYCRVHGYAPPQPFVEAVLQCPDFSAAAYAEQVRRFSGLGTTR